MVKNFFKNLYAWIIYIFLYAPIAVMLVLSFNASRSRTKWGGFTLDWYRSLFEDEAVFDALMNTLWIAVLSSLIATVLAVMASLVIYNMRNKVAKTVIVNITSLPMLNPDIVTGVSLMILFIFFGVSRGFGSLLLAHITFNVPYVVMSILPKMKQLDNSIYEAALDLGAKPAKAFFKIILPQIMPGIITGMILAFTLSIDDFIISFFTTGAGVSNLSIYIYSMTKRGISPELYALSSIMFFTVLFLLLIVNFRLSSGKKEEQVKRI